MSVHTLQSPGERPARPINEPPPALPVGWSWHIHRSGVLVIEHNGEPAGWVALSDTVPFTADLGNHLTRTLATDTG